MTRRKPSRHWDFVRETFRQYNLVKCIFPFPEKRSNIDKKIERTTMHNSYINAYTIDNKTRQNSHLSTLLTSDRPSSPLTDANGLCKSGRKMGGIIDISRPEMNTTKKTKLLEQDAHRRRHIFLQKALTEEALICGTLGMDRSGMCIRHQNQLIFDVARQSIGMTEYQNHAVNTCRICRSESQGGNDGNLRRHRPAMINVIEEVQQLQSDRTEWTRRTSILGMKSSHHGLQIRLNTKSLKINEDDLWKDDDDSVDEFGGDSGDYLTEEKWVELAGFRISQVRAWQDFFGIKNHPFFCHYFKMIQYGVPIEAVKYAVETDGYDPSIMDLDINLSLEMQLDQLSSEALENLRSKGALVESSNTDNNSNSAVEFNIPNTIRRVMFAFRHRRSNQIFAVSALHEEFKYNLETNISKDNNVLVAELKARDQQGSNQTLLDANHKCMSDLCLNNVETRSDWDEALSINHRQQVSTPNDQHKHSEEIPLCTPSSGRYIDEGLNISQPISSRALDIAAHIYCKKSKGLGSNSANGQRKYSTQMGELKRIQRNSVSIQEKMTIDRIQKNQPAKLPLIVILNEESQRSDITVSTNEEGFFSKSIGNTSTRNRKKKKKSSKKKNATKISLASTKSSSKIAIKDETKSSIGMKMDQSGSSRRVQTQSKTKNTLNDEPPVKEIVLVDDVNDRSLTLDSVQSELESFIRRELIFKDVSKGSKEKSVDEVGEGTSVLTDNDSNNTESVRNGNIVSNNSNVTPRESQLEIPTPQIEVIFDNTTKVSVPFNGLGNGGNTNVTAAHLKIDDCSEDSKNLKAELVHAMKIISAKNIKIHNLQQELKRKDITINFLEHRIHDMNETSNTKLHNLQQDLEAKHSGINNFEHQIQEMSDKSYISSTLLCRVNDESNITGSGGDQDAWTKAEDRSIDKQDGSIKFLTHVVNINTSRELHKNENITPIPENIEIKNNQKCELHIVLNENVVSNKKGSTRENSCDSDKHRNPNEGEIILSNHSVCRKGNSCNEKDKSKHSKKQRSYVHERRAKSRKPSHGNIQGNMITTGIDEGSQDGGGKKQENESFKRANTSNRNVIDVIGNKHDNIVMEEPTIAIKSRSTHSIDVGGNNGGDEGIQAIQISPFKNDDTVTKQVILSLFNDLIN